MTASDNSSEARFADLIQRFVSAEKVIPAPMKWLEGKTHPDYAIAVMRVVCPDFPRVKARVILSSHVYFDPRKYSFVLLFGRTRIVALDVSPRRSHRNLLGPRISGTHWQYFPTYEAIPDDRHLSHYQWLDLFLKKCNIAFFRNYVPPTHDKEQLRFAL